MIDASKITEHMEVVGSDGQHVGTVDKVEGERIKLTKTDPAAHGEHHIINMDLVAEIGTQVKLRQPAAQVKQVAAGS